MASDPYVRHADGVFSATIGSTAVIAGDLLYFDGTDWERADADVHTTFAEAIALNSQPAGSVGNLCTSGILVDVDAPFTQGDQYYLAAPAGTPTAGNFTATRPTTAGNLRQVVGFGISTSELRLEIAMPTEHHMCYNFISTEAAESGIQLDNAGGGDFITVHTNADGEDIGATFAIPQNAVAIEFASVFTAAEVVTGASNYAWTVSGAADGEQHNGGTQDTTLTAQTSSGAVADELQRITATTGFDAAGLLQPDNVIGFHGIHGGAQTDVIVAFCLEVVYLVV